MTALLDQLKIILQQVIDNDTDVGKIHLATFWQSQVAALEAGITDCKNDTAINHINRTSTYIRYQLNHQLQNQYESMLIMICESAQEIFCNYYKNLKPAGSEKK